MKIGTKIPRVPSHPSEKCDYGMMEEFAGVFGAEGVALLAGRFLKDFQTQRIFFSEVRGRGLETNGYKNPDRRPSTLRYTSVPAYIQLITNNIALLPTTRRDRQTEDNELY